MLILGASTAGYSMICPHQRQRQAVAVGIKEDVNKNKQSSLRKPAGLAGLVATAIVMMSVMKVEALTQPQPQPDTLSNIPQMLSGECISGKQDCKKARIQRPKSRKAESCTIKCVGTCIRGGVGSPGEGPLNVRRPLVVFKQGFRSRQYCLVECSDICNLIRDGDDGP